MRKPARQKQVNLGSLEDWFHGLAVCKEFRGSPISRRGLPCPPRCPRLPAECQIDTIFDGTGNAFNGVSPDNHQQRTTPKASRMKAIKPATAHLPAIQIGLQVDLPDLVASQKVGVGHIRQQLRPASTELVESVEPFPVSPKRVEYICTLITGERFVISASKNCECPMGVDGVLFRDTDGSLNWSGHKSLETFRKVGDPKASLEWQSYRDGVTQRWKNCVRFQSEAEATTDEPATPGLRSAQLGALHNIVGHWELDSDPCTVVMPTGTGKTEVMLATAVHAAGQGTMLVVVPTAPLREQTERKFLTLGLLRDLGVIPKDVPNPIVGVIRHRPKSDEDLQVFERCHLVIATMASLSQGTAVRYHSQIADRVATIVIDEAHHIAANTWNQFRDHFQTKQILLLSATPFRRDGKLVDGKVIFDYGLGRAQKDGHFRSIEFKAVYEFDETKGDLEIAKQAVSQLKEDLTAGYEHLVMARCDSIERSKQIVKIYEDLAPEYEPIVVHSQMGKQAAVNLQALREFKSRIVVCVDMLGEGFDLPNLKIAAVHDTHKSLAVLLQFTGRFTRSSGDAIGTATVIANTANQDVSTALERLYDEDADWNQLLSDFSSQAARHHRELTKFLDESKRLDRPSDDALTISKTLLRPKCSVAVFRCSKFGPRQFYKAIAANASVEACWLHQETQTVYYVTRRVSPVNWTRSKEIRDVCWDLFVLHYNTKQQLLFLGSSDKSSLHEPLARAVGGEGTALVRGDSVFRAFGRVNRLRFHQIGVKKVGRRNLSYALYSGSDVQDALTASQKAGSYKSNLAGTGFANGESISVGCSYKGRIWSMDKGTIRTFIDWCDAVGDKLIDQSIDPSTIIKNVLVPDEIYSLPKDVGVLSVDWPEEIWRMSFDRIVVANGEHKNDLSFVDIEHSSTDIVANEIHFRVRAPEWVSEYTLFIGGKRGFDVALKSGSKCQIKIGRRETELSEYFKTDPPLFLMSDLSELNGNLWFHPQEKTALQIPNDRFESWDWTNVDIKQESMWKDGKLRTTSIQQRVATEFLSSGVDILFDDDAAGEAADLVGFKEFDETIELSLIHCKFAGAETAGDRVKDVVEVCSQAIRSCKWKWKFKELCKHIILRENKLSKNGRATRFLCGNEHEMNRFLRLHRGKEIVTRIIVVQPGLKEDCTDDQRYVLAATDSYLLETIGVKLEVVCSK